MYEQKMATVVSFRSLMVYNKGSSSPLLFAIAIDWVLQLATKERDIAWLKGNCPPQLNFAALAEVPSAYKSW